MLTIVKSSFAADQQFNVSASIMTDSIAKSSASALKAVVRVICPASDNTGTGFLHPSGWIITAAHVVANCKSEDIIVIPPDGVQLNVVDARIDQKLNLAALKLKNELKIPPLFISRTSTNQLVIGSQVGIWGFPVGYNSSAPLLAVGYISGSDRVRTELGLSPTRLVVNAAFNSGNSGGPVIDIEDGTVIGVVSSKLAPVPQIIQDALRALQNQHSGFIYTAKSADGKEVTISEGQIIGAVLDYLRSQTQLVVGHAVTADDLHTFLKDKKIEK